MSVFHHHDLCHTFSHKRSQKRTPVEGKRIRPSFKHQCHSRHKRGGASLMPSLDDPRNAFRTSWLTAFVSIFVIVHNHEPRMFISCLGMRMPWMSAPATRRYGVAGTSVKAKNHQRSDVPKRLPSPFISKKA